jgi:hypothetical protein
VERAHTAGRWRLGRRGVKSSGTGGLGRPELRIFVDLLELSLQEGLVFLCQDLRFVVGFALPAD